MNVQFGTGFTVSQNNTGAQGSDARTGVAVPAEAENQSTTSFTPVQEANEAPKSKQEDAQKGVEERQAIEQRRAKQQQEERQLEQRLDRERNNQAESEASEPQEASNQQEQSVDERSRQEQQAQERRQQETQEQRQLEIEQRQIQQLAERDREVRAHEQAHQAVGGQYAGAVSLQYERGPDGQNYAIAGEVPISTSKVPNDPQATLDKAETIRRAALAPAEPSSQDRRVAAEAIQMTLEARSEIQQQQQEEFTKESSSEEKSESEELSEEERLGAEQKAQQQVEDEVTESSVSADFQELNERLARIQAQLVEASNIDEKFSGVNLLDVTT